MAKHKKPNIKKFRAVSDECGGNITAIAKKFGVYRTTIYEWLNDDANFKEVIDDTRGKVVDDCFVTAQLLAKGIPIIQGEKLVGWEERPDASMVRYLLSTLGRKEGFGENVDVTSNGKDIQQVTIFELPDNGRDVENKQD